MPHLPEMVGESLKEPGAVPLALHACAYAHLFQEEVVIDS